MFSAGTRPPTPAVEDFCERARTVLAPNGHEILGWPEPAPIRGRVFSA
jgi:hypothetical protein